MSFFFGCVEEDEEKEEEEKGEGGDFIYCADGGNTQQDEFF